VNRVELDKANEGIAMALAMESPAIPAGANHAFSAGVGYFQSKTAFSAAFSSRVGNNGSISAGIGVGVDSGEFGARAGFQRAW